MSPTVEEVTIEDVALDGCVWARTGECDSCPELVAPTGVTAVFVEGSIAFVSVVTGVSSELLLKFGGKLVSGSRLDLNVSVTFPKPEFSGKRCEVTGRGEEVLCPCNVNTT